MFRRTHLIGYCLGGLMAVTHPARADDLGRIFGTIAGEVVREHMRQQRSQPQQHQPQAREPARTPSQTQPQQRQRNAAPQPQQPQMSLERRMAVQRALTAAGHYSGEIDGILGSGSRRAIASWQAAMGASATGYLLDQQAQALIATSQPPTANTVAQTPDTAAAPPTDFSAAVATDSGSVHNPTTPNYADFVHMALMSDAAAYADDADELGLSYLSAVTSPEDCHEIRMVRQQRDEFSRRDEQTQAAAMMRQAIASLVDRPRRVEVAVEETIGLSNYDFDQGGYLLTNSYGASILNPGIWSLEDRSAGAACDFGHGAFSRLSAEHGGVPGLTFLPMTEDAARAFRAAGGNRVTVKATLVVEPRNHGRGPLKGSVTGVTIRDPNGDRVLLEWDGMRPPEAATSSNVAPDLSGALVARIIAPVLEPHFDSGQLQNAATNYFSTYANEIENGNPPPGSPLPIEAMRGQTPQMIASVNEPRLRQMLQAAGPELPLTVTFTQQVSPFFDRDLGLMLEAAPREGDPLAGLELSDRGLILLDHLLPRRLFGNDDFASVVAGFRATQIRVEVDRLMQLAPVPMDLDHANALGLVGGTGDSATLSWVLDIIEARGDADQVIISMAIKGMTARWDSDGSMIMDKGATDFTSIAALQQQAAAQRGPRASADAVMTPPDGARWGAEMTDLLQLRYAPETVTDQMIERMMISRFNAESQVKEGTPPWGRFFHDAESMRADVDRKAGLADFRRWSEARAAALPATLTLRLPLVRGGEETWMQWERVGRPDVMYYCDSVDGQDQESESALASARICAYLDAAWKTPEPLLFLADEYARGARTALRSDCKDDDYCSAINSAEHALGIARIGKTDIVRLDRLPVVSPEMRSKPGELAVEIEVAPTTGAVEDAFPTSFWRTAMQRAYEFGQDYGISTLGNPTPQEPPGPLLVMNASAVSARLIDRASGAVLSDLPLADAMPPSTDVLAMPESKMTGVNILGIGIGSSFDDADRLIRDHMEVGKVLTADRAAQLSAAGAGLRPYSSGRIYVSANETEMIAIFDEPPAATGKVVGLWRVLRLPQGSVKLAGLRNTLSERYGEPRAIDEINLAFMSKGVVWSWHDPVDRGCSELRQERQPDLWQDETGATGWAPSLLSESALPILAYSTEFDRATDNPLILAQFCPAVLGVRFASYDGSTREQPVGDEIITWLSDNRAYARLYIQSSKAPPPSDPDKVVEKVDIDF